jgi:hypothetical protein
MKKALIIILWTIYIHAQAQKEFLQEIVYTVPLKYSGYENAIKNPAGALQASELFKFIAPILNKIKRGEITCYGEYYPFADVLLTRNEAINRLVKKYSMIDNDDSRADFKPDVTIEVTDTILYSQIGAIQFHEEWYLDKTDLSIEKKVKGIVLLKEIYDNNTGTYKGNTPALYIKLNSADASIVTQENLIKKDFYSETYIKNPDEYYREVEWWFENLEPSKRFKLNQSVIDKLKGNTFPIYDCYNTSVKLGSSEIANTITSFDSVEVYDDSGMPILEVRKNELAWNEITKVGFNETWYFDINKLTMMKIVHGIIPMKEQLKNNSVEVFEYVRLVYMPVNNSKSNITTNRQITVNEFTHTNNIKLDTGYAGKWANINAFAGIDTSAYYKIMSHFTSGIESGILNCYDYYNFYRSYGKNKKTLSTAEVKNIMHQTDTILVIDTSTDKEKIITHTTDITPKMCKGIQFIESWKFDGEKYNFSKTVKSIVPAYEYYNKSDGVFLGFKYLPVVDINSTNEKEMEKKSFLIADKISYLVSIKCAHDWRENYFNYNDWAINCMELSERKQMLDLILADVKSGKVTAYLPDGKYNTKIKPADLKSIFNYKFLVGDNFLEEKLDYSKVAAIEFNEAWYFNAEKNMFYKKVIGITLMRDKAMGAKGEGEYIPLFYISIN